MARTLYWIAPVPTPYLDYLWRHVTKAIPSTTVVLKNHASGGHPWKSKMGEGYRTVCADKKGFDWSIVRLAKDRRLTPRQRADFASAAALEAQPRHASHTVFGIGLAPER